MFSTRKKREVLIPLFSFLSLNFIVFLLWNSAVDIQKSNLETQVKNTGEILTEKINTIVRSDIQKLENLQNRLETTDGEYFEYWEHDAEMILKQNPSFKFIEWIDEDMIIRKINPYEANKAAIGLDISTVEYRRDEWLRHKRDSSTNITSWAKLTQGGNAFLVDVPVYFKNQFQGTITAGMDFKENLDDFAVNLKDYGIILRDDQGSKFYQHHSVLKDSLNPKFAFTTTLPIDPLDSQNWSIVMTPVSSSYLMDKNSSATFLLIFGLTLSTLLSLIIYYYLRARKEATRAIRTNKKLKKTNKKLSKERNKAQRASKAKSEFLSNMSHEIRTPLNAILGFTQLLKEPMPKETNSMYLDLMNKASKNLLSLVNDVLDIDQIESGETKLNTIAFNPSEELIAIVKQYEAEFEQKNLFLTIDFMEPYGKDVVGDEVKFNQVLINLIKNALKFTQAGGATVSYKESLDNNKLNVSVTIADTGIGIPKDKLSKIFKRFKQIDDGIKKQHKGSGLGLSISSNLAALMGGKLTVASELHIGSEFNLSIPFNLANPLADKTESIDEALNINLEDINVLIVDDNMVNLLVLTKILEQLGISSNKAKNGEEAIKMAGAHNYQIILMDIHMPRLDGYEATKIIRDTNSDVLIVGLSADVTNEAIEKALDTGMNDYLTKPVTKRKIADLFFKYFSE